MARGNRSLSRALKLISQAQRSRGIGRARSTPSCSTVWRIRRGAARDLRHGVPADPNEGDEAFRAALDRHRGPRGDRRVHRSRRGAPGGGRGFQPWPAAATLVADPVTRPARGLCQLPGGDFDGVIRRLWFTVPRQETLFRATVRRNPATRRTTRCSRPPCGRLGRADLIPADRAGNAGSATRIYASTPREQHLADYRPHPLWEIFSDATWKQNYQNGAVLQGQDRRRRRVGPDAARRDFTPYGQIPGPDLHLQVLTAALGQEYSHACTGRPHVDLAHDRGGGRAGVGGGCGCPRAAGATGDVLPLMSVAFVGGVCAGFTTTTG